MPACAAEKWLLDVTPRADALWRDFQNSNPRQKQKQGAPSPNMVALGRFRLQSCSRAVSLFTGICSAVCGGEILKIGPGEV